MNKLKLWWNSPKRARFFSRVLFWEVVGLFAVVIFATLFFMLVINPEVPQYPTCLSLTKSPVDDPPPYCQFDPLKWVEETNTPAFMRR